MTFETMIDFIIDRIEKGYANNPQDDGGATNWGISERAHPEWKGRMKEFGSRLKVDGVIGPMTLSALRKMDAPTFLAAYCRERLALYKKHPDYGWAGASWEYRLFLVCAAS